MALTASKFFVGAIIGVASLLCILCVVFVVYRVRRHILAGGSLSLVGRRRHRNRGNKQSRAYRVPLNDAMLESNNYSSIS